jgi:hypothetical protein
MNLTWLLNRLSENSTWRGIILLATAAGLKLAPELWDSIIAIGLSIVGLINVVRKAPNAPDNNTGSPAS